MTLESTMQEPEGSWARSQSPAIEKNATQDPLRVLMMIRREANLESGPFARLIPMVALGATCYVQGRRVP